MELIGAREVMSHALTYHELFSMKVGRNDVEYASL
jgi:hypothetical protein